MTENRIADRMKDFFGRQIAWMRHWQQETDAAGDDCTEATWIRLSDAYTRHQAELHQLEEEFRLLEREWSASDDISDDERSDVAALALEAREAAVVLARWFDESAHRAQIEGEAIQSELTRVRRESGQVRKFLNADDDPASEWIDRQA